MVAALRHATQQTPVATGKPDPTMHAEMVTRTGAQRPLIVGDRLDTDIAGAVAAGCPSLLVLTGVTSVAGSLAAGPAERPSYLAPDLSGLLRAHPHVETSGSTARCGRWQAAAVSGALGLALELSGATAPTTDADARGAAAAGSAGPSALSEDDVDAWRSLCAAWWEVGVSGTVPPVESADDAARPTLMRLGLLDG